MAINLLPPEIKRERKIKKGFKFALVFVFIFVLILLITTGGVVAANYYSTVDLNRVKEKIAEQDKILHRYKATEENVNKINNKLKKIEAESTNKTIWSNVLNEIAANTPKTIQIKTLSLSQETKKVTLTGFAETRSDIAKFKEKMEQSKYFQNVIFSSSVHNQERSNFSYSISCELKEIK